MAEKNDSANSDRLSPFEADLKAKIAVLKARELGARDFPERLAIMVEMKALIDQRQTLLSALVPDASAPAVDPYRTGAQGRPTASHLVKAEFERRLKGRAPVALKDEAADLLRWLKDNHPSAPPTTQGTIQNTIRKLWQKAPKRPTK